MKRIHTYILALLLLAGALPAGATAQQSADVSVLLVPKFDVAVPGGELTFFAFVRNNGPGAAASVSLVFQAPAGARFLSAGGPQTWSFQTPPFGETGNTFAFTPTLDGGETATLRFTYTLSPDVSPGSIAASVGVTSETVDGNTANNSATATVTALDGSNFRSDVTVTMTDGPDPVTPDANGVFFITLRAANPGPEAAVAVAVQYFPPSGTFFDDTPKSPSAGRVFEPSDGETSLLWTVNSIPAGGAETLVLGLRVRDTGEGDLFSGAAVDSGSIDLDENNNFAAEMTTVAAEPGRANFVVTVDPLVFSSPAGDPIPYRIRITGGGGRNVTAHVAFGRNTKFLSATTSRGQIVPPRAGTSSGLVVALGDVAAGATTEIIALLRTTDDRPPLVDARVGSSTAFDAGYQINPTPVAIDTVARATVSWDAPNVATGDRPPPRNLTVTTDGAAAPADEKGGSSSTIVCYNVYAATTPDVEPSPKNFFTSVPPSQTSTQAPVAAGGSFFVVTACYGDGESDPSNEDGEVRATGPSLAAPLKIKNGKLVANGSGFAAGALAFVDGIPFGVPSKIKRAGQRLVQRSPLLTGQQLEQYLTPGREALVTFRNANGGTTRVRFTR